MPAALKSVARPRARSGAFRQDQEPVPMLRVDMADLSSGAAAIVDRIASIARHRACCAYLFMRPDQWVYVLSEDVPKAHHWAVHEHPEWWLGCYGGKVDPEQIEAELLAAL